MSDRRLRGRGASFSATCGVVRYHTDPSGTLTPYAAHAIGNGHEGALALLEEKYSKSMNLRDAELLVARVLRDTMEEKVSATNIQIAAVSQHDNTGVMVLACTVVDWGVSMFVLPAVVRVHVVGWFSLSFRSSFRIGVVCCGRLQVTPAGGYQLYSQEKLEELIAALAADPAHGA